MLCAYRLVRIGKDGRRKCLAEAMDALYSHRPPLGQSLPVGHKLRAPQIRIRVSVFLWVKQMTIGSHSLLLGWEDIDLSYLFDLLGCPTRSGE